MPPKARTPGRGGRRAASAAPAESEVTEPVANGTANDEKEETKDAEAMQVDELQKTPRKTRGKRPRVSDEGMDVDEAPATSSRQLRPRRSSVAPETPSRRKRETTPRAAKRVRVAATPRPQKPNKVGLNGLPSAFPILEPLPAFTFQPTYDLPNQLDPRKDGNPPLSVFVCGQVTEHEFRLNGKSLIPDDDEDEPFGQDEIGAATLHAWFKKNSETVAAAPQTNGKGEDKADDATNGDDSKMDAAEEQKATKSSPLGPHGIVDISAGAVHTMAVDSEGKVWSWGTNDQCALGRPTEMPNQEQSNGDGSAAEPSAPQIFPIESLHDEGFRAVKVAALDNLSAALDSQGNIRIWGTFMGPNGPVGLDGVSEKPELNPTPVPELKGQAVVQVVGGDFHIMALTSDGHVYAWGNGEQMQLGRRVIMRHMSRSYIPEKVGLRNIVHIAAGHFHSFAIDNKGVVYAWGLNNYRQTGISERDGGLELAIPTAEVVADLHPKKLDGAKVVQIAGGEHQSYFLLDNGTVLACGRCDDGQLGLGDDHPEVSAVKQAAKEARVQYSKTLEDEREKLRAEGCPVEDIEDKATQLAQKNSPIVSELIAEPTKITFPKEGDEEAKIVKLACRARHCIAVSSTGVAYAWGYGVVSQLGIPDEQLVPTPRRMPLRQGKGYKVVGATTAAQYTYIVAAKPAEAAKP